MFKRKVFLNKKRFIKEIERRLLAHPITEEQILEIVALSGKLKDLGINPEAILVQRLGKESKRTFGYKPDNDTLFCGGVFGEGT
jgi:hypothetical protein